MKSCVWYVLGFTKSKIFTSVCCHKESACDYNPRSENSKNPIQTLKHESAYLMLEVINCYKDVKSAHMRWQQYQM